MKDLKSILEECSINDIYFSNRGASILYKIPIYQRNYAWEREEIYALIKDVYDSLEKSVYYIGTLVTYKRDENTFEVIDGQQRLTTIYIILKALGIETIANRLTYSARKVSAMTIEKIPMFGEEKDQAIVDGLNFAKEALKDIVGEKKADIGAFKDFFLNKVHIINYRVPKDVDLNHYFEVMNSRGEQLEKHEIVKAKLSEQLIGDDAAMETFSRIWEACSDMSFYIQQKLPDMTSVFGKTMESFIPQCRSWSHSPASDRQIQVPCGVCAYFGFKYSLGGLFNLFFAEELVQLYAVVLHDGIHGSPFAGEYSCTIPMARAVPCVCFVNNKNLFHIVLINKICIGNRQRNRHLSPK